MQRNNIYVFFMINYGNNKNNDSSFLNNQCIINAFCVFNVHFILFKLHKTHQSFKVKYNEE